MSGDGRSSGLSRAAKPSATGRPGGRTSIRAIALPRLHRCSPPKPLNAAQFFTWFAASLVALIGLTIGLTVAVDPYRMYGTPPIPGWTALKPEIYDHIGMALTYQLERVRPDTLLLGNSRVEVGFDPESKVWPSSARPVFNAAEPGRDLRAAVDMLRDAIAVHIPKTVIVGLDILDFLQKPTLDPAPQPTSRAEDRRLLVDRDGKPNPERWLQMWRDRLATTLSIDAVVDSVATLFDQNPQTAETITALGFDPMNEYRIFASRQGYYELFAQKNAIYRAQYPHYTAPDFAHPMAYREFCYLQEITDLTREHNITLILFIHPYHTDYLDMLREVGLWPAFEAWKRAIVNLVAAAKTAEARDEIRLFDFSGYSRITSEPVPPPRDRHTVMHWYWEAGHYKSSIGDQMLRTMFGEGGRFGVALTRANLDQVLAEIRASRARYEARRMGEIDLDNKTRSR